MQKQIGLQHHLKFLNTNLFLEEQKSNLSWFEFNESKISLDHPASGDNFNITKDLKSQTIKHTFDLYDVADHKLYLTETLKFLVCTNAFKK